MEEPKITKEQAKEALENLEQNLKCFSEEAGYVSLDSINLIILEKYIEGQEEV